jgi:hypothetical protein
MYTCFIYYDKCIHDQFHICIRSMECEINEMKWSTTTTKPAATKARQTGPSAQQMDLGEGWSHVVREGELSVPPFHPQLPLQLIWSRTHQTAKSDRHQEDGQAYKTCA